MSKKSVKVIVSELEEHGFKVSVARGGAIIRVTDRAGIIKGTAYRRSYEKVWSGYTECAPQGETNLVGKRAEVLDWLAAWIIDPISNCYK